MLSIQGHAFWNLSIVYPQNSSLSVITDLNEEKNTFKYD